MRSINMTAITVLLPISLCVGGGCVVKTIDVLPGVPLRITHATVTQDPDVRQNGEWVPASGRVTIEPGEVVVVPLPPRTVMPAAGRQGPQQIH
jgi:hypothetical protein